jgi:hypothetical protein
MMQVEHMLYDLLGGINPCNCEWQATQHTACSEDLHISQWFL